MMMRKVLLGAILMVGAVALTAPSAPASTIQTLTVFNGVHVNRRVLLHLEGALVDQSRQLRWFWGTPVVRFAGGGWPVFLEGRNQGPDTAPGWHSVMDGIPYAWIYVEDAGHDWTGAVSHEMLEMLVNPYPDGQPFGAFGWQKEVCDPTNGILYYSHGDRGFLLSDFVTPSWFSGGKPPYDWGHLLPRPGVFHA